MEQHSPHRKQALTSALTHNPFIAFFVTRGASRLQQALHNHYRRGPSGGFPIQRYHHHHYCWRCCQRLCVVLPNDILAPTLAFYLGSPQCDSRMYAMSAPSASFAPLSLVWTTLSLHTYKTAMTVIALCHAMTIVRRRGRLLRTSSRGIRQIIFVAAHSRPHLLCSSFIITYCLRLSFSTESTRLINA